MTLESYRRKRKFSESPEPKAAKKSRIGTREPRPSPLRFVVQKHDASRLHYDFRIELDGVLKSWAVPKGPSMNPSDKRLAVQVEDHPCDYRTFEGTIPEGNYGAGTVMVWDEGSYTSAGEADRTRAEKALRKGLRAGKIDLVMAGHKLAGEFSLVRMNGVNWLLIKKKDKYATTSDITRKGRSVLTHRGMDEIANA